MIKRRRLRVWFSLGVLAILFWSIAKFVITPSIVWGDSMEPTLHNWDLCLLRRCRDYQPHRGDIVIFRTANNPPLLFIKRVIALPGEAIAIERGKVLVNGSVLAEPYTSPNPDWSLAATNVPPDRIYVIGDNREVPMDLAVQGIVATRLVNARLVWHWSWKK